MTLKTTLASITPRIQRKNVLFAIAVGIGTMTTTVLMATAPEHAPQEVDEKVWPVSTTLVEVDSLSPELQVYGRVESPRHTRLSSALDAPVVAVHVSEGDSVQKGEPLVTLDAAEAQLVHAQRAADLAGNLATLESLAADFDSEQRVLAQMQELQELAERRVNRLRELYARQLVSTTEVDTLKQEVSIRRIELSRQQALVERQPQRLAAARAAVDSARAALDEQQLRLERSVLRAPFDGRVTLVNASEGDRVTPGKVLVALYDLEKLRVRARLPSALVPRLKSHVASGTRISAAIAGRLDMAELDQLSSEIESGSSGIDAFFRLPTGSSLEIGRTVDLVLQLPPVDNVVAVPQQSLHRNRYIYVVENQRLRAVAVAT
ncbi:efflux RND transporter periplasmic adaptor subunit, partial [Chromatocurvus halotolerans]